MRAPPVKAEYWIAWNRDNASRALLDYVQILKAFGRQHRLTFATVLLGSLIAISYYRNTLQVLGNLTPAWHVLWQRPFVRNHETLWFRR